MSWGERSCKKPCQCPDKCNMATCNVNCPEYIWDGVTKPDSKPKPIYIRKSYKNYRKSYKNYLNNQRLRRKNPNIRSIVSGKPVSFYKS